MEQASFAATPFRNGGGASREYPRNSQTRSQNPARVIKFAQKGFHDENLFCPCDHVDAAVFVSARSCRYDLSNAAMPCVRRHQLYSNPGPMRGSGAVLSPQVILAACKTIVIFLLSIARATQRPANHRRPLKPAGLSANWLKSEKPKGHGHACLNCIPNHPPGVGARLDAGRRCPNR